RPLGGADLDHAVHRVGGDLGGDHLGVGDLAVGQVLADGDGALAVAALLDHAGLAFVQVVGLALDHLVLDRFGLLLGLGAVPHDRDGGDAVLGAGDGDVVLLADVDLCLPQRLAQRHGAVHLDGALLAVGHDGDRAVRGQRQLELDAAVGAAGLDRGVAPVVVQVAQGSAGGQRRGPDLGLLAVLDDGDLVPGTHHDVVAVLQGFIGAGHDLIVSPDFTYGVIQQAVVPAGEGGHGRRLTVDVHVDRLVCGGHAHTRSPEQQHGGGCGADQHAAPAAPLLPAGGRTGGCPTGCGARGTGVLCGRIVGGGVIDRTSTRLNSSDVSSSYAAVCLTKKESAR